MQRIAVIGAGIVGACAALRLQQAGFAVTIIDPGPPGGRQAASYGNGAWISPASVIPMAGPGMWRRVPGYLLDRSGPLTIRWADLPRLAPWLLRFLYAGRSVAAVRKTATALHSLLHDAPARHRSLAAEVGRADLIQSSGLIYAFADQRAMETDALSWAIRRDLGVNIQPLGRADLARLVPCLGPGYGLGQWIVDGAHCLDPGAYVAAIVRAAQALGAILLDTKALRLVFDGGSLLGIDTAQGLIACDKVVIAAGIHSARFAAQAGNRIPMISERGYHITLHNPAVGPQVPVMPQDGKMANTMVHDGLRISGQVELARIDAPPDWRRADILLAHAKRAYPALAAQTDLQTDVWMGHRPSTSDGLPVISGAARSRHVIHAFGHGHVGLATAPATADLVMNLVADTADGTKNGPDPAPFAAARFRL